MTFGDKEEKEFSKFRLVSTKTILIEWTCVIDDEPRVQEKQQLKHQQYYWNVY